MPENKTFHWRHLPHYYPEDTIFFVTFRLAGSMPAEIIAQLKDVNDQRKIEPRDRWEHRFTDYDAALDKVNNNICWLMDERIASAMTEAIKYRDGKEYDLFSYCIMPNHVHMIFGTGKHEILGVGQNDILSTTGEVNKLSNKSLSKILQSLKRYSAHEANKILQRTGSFWQDESYDHVVKDAVELERLIYYILYNPVKAGLVKNWRHWNWTYCKPEYEPN
jgi:putative transposase